MAAGPDFICIGMPKAGTAWLYDQLTFHPEFWLPPVKELSYLGYKRPPMLHVRRVYQLSRAESERRPTNRAGRKWDERDLAFLGEAVALVRRDRDVARYAALFRHKGALKSGDITPTYCLMTTDIISEVAAKLPHLKVIYLIRDPIARLWSRINQHHNDGRFDPTLLEDAAAFTRFLDDHPLILEHSRPTQALARWREAAPSLPFQYHLFDDIVRNPKQTRRRILRFLGADPKTPSAHLPDGYNRKSGRPKLVMTETIRSVLSDRFGGEVRACASLLGGPARDWPALYGL